MDLNISPKENIATASIYDIEIEDREADRPELPRRQRFYSSVTDSKILESGKHYKDLPNYVSITILSYDPFSAGDMFYQAETVLTSHPTISYDDGRIHIFLYAHGNPNFKDETYGKNVSELLQFIVTGTKSDFPSESIKMLDQIVSKVKSRAEVTKRFMKQWDREYHIAMDARAEGAAQATAATEAKDAIILIRLFREKNISDTEIRQDIIKNFGFDNNTIDSLFEQASRRTETIM